MRRSSGSAADPFPSDAMKPDLLAALLLAPAWLAAPASAQVAPAGPVDVMEDVRYVCALYDHGDEVAPGPVLDLSAVEAARRGVTYSRVVSGGGAAATFQVDYSDAFTPQARAAFQRAVDIWSTHLTSTVPIRIRANFDALEENVLGQAGPRIARLTDGVTETWFAFALADALLGRDAAPEADAYDIEATFSSSFSRFYFGLDGNPPSNQIDFVSVVLHELGHGLGFIGSGSVDDGVEEVECTGVAGVGCIGIEANDGLTSPIIFDRFLVDAANRDALDPSVYPNNSSVLGDLFQSENLFVDAPTVVRIYGSRAPVWAPAEFEPGSSFSHWDEIVIRGSSAALMTPALASGEAYQDPGDITCAFFFDTGWELGAGCQTLTVANEPALAVAGLRLDPDGPNPTRQSTAFRLRLPAPGDVRVTLHDALGRRLAVLLDGPARAEEPVPLDVSGLAPGVYHVVVRADLGTVTRSVTVVR